MILRNIYWKKMVDNKVLCYLRKYRYILIYIVCISIISMTYAMGRIYISDFYPINGDFQNYNAFRRLLNGQMPYKNFANYLGIGVLIINAPFLLFKNNFTASLFITNFTACFVFCVAVTVLFYLCTNKKGISCVLGAISPFVCSLAYKDTVISSIFSFVNMYMPGNSMRTQRAFLPFLLAILFIIFKRYYINKQDINIVELFKSKKNIAILGFIIGLFITWSNDFGFACFASSFVIIALLFIYINKKINFECFYLLSIFVLTAIIGFLISVFIVSGGSIKSYFDFTFGVASYQFWYYGATMPQNKILTFIDIFNNRTYDIYIIIFTAITIIYIIKILKKSIEDNDILAYFIELSTFFASIIYIYGSGGYLIEAFSLSTFIIAVSYIINILLYLLKRFRFRFEYLATYKVYCISLTMLTVIYSYYLTSEYLQLKDKRPVPYVNKYLQLKDERPIPYVDELKGYTTYGESLNNAKNLIRNEKVFSTYASALELMLNKYQPSGIDYIIHVLGDKQREIYINNFKENKYKYVTTIKEELIDHESWVKRANWFFYRELYKSYIPVSSTDYSIIWEKTNEVNIKSSYNIKYKKIDDHTYQLTVTSDNKSDMVADVSIKYKSSYTKNINRLLTFRRIVSVQDNSMFNENNSGWCNYSIPNESLNYNIPIFLYNGEGKIIITSYPNNCTSLDIMDAKVNELLPYYFNQFYSGIQVSKIDDMYWNNGIKRDANIILFKNSELNRKALSDAKQVKSDNVIKNISSIKYFDNQWIWVTLDDGKGIEEFSYPNKIELIK